MTRESTLQRVEAEIAAGDLGKARDRLHGLIGSFPNDLALRSRLAEVYARLHYRHMAGCYWFLTEDPTKPMEEAIVAFKKRCGNEPWVMLHSIKFRGDPTTLPPHAGSQWKELIKQCRKKYGSYPDFQGKKTTYVQTIREKATFGMMFFLFLGVVVLVLVCAVIGFCTLLGLVF